MKCQFFALFCCGIVSLQLANFIQIDIKNNIQDAQSDRGQLEVKLGFATKTLHTTKINETISV